MDFIGGIDGMNFTPISNYNNYLKNNVTFDENSSMEFENILNNQTMAIQDSFKIQGGVELNNFDDIVAQNSIQSSGDNSTNGGDFIKNMAKSMSSGLSAVNNNVEAANRAQEAMAMGEDVSVHDVMIASEKATLSLQMAMQLRNKLMSAYTEINNVRV